MRASWRHHTTSAQGKQVAEATVRSGRILSPSIGRGHAQLAHLVAQRLWQTLFQWARGIVPLSLRPGGGSQVGDARRLQAARRGGGQPRQPCPTGRISLPPQRRQRSRATRRSTPQRIIRGSRRIGAGSWRASCGSVSRCCAPMAAPMWDLTVSNVHDYAVGADAYVVHN